MAVHTVMFVLSCGYQAADGSVDLIALAAGLEPWQFRQYMACVREIVVRRNAGGMRREEN